MEWRGPAGANMLHRSRCLNHTNALLFTHEKLWRNISTVLIDDIRPGNSSLFSFSAPAEGSLLRMSTPYERVKGGKLTFKGGLGPEKAIKKSKKHKKKVAAQVEEDGVSAAEKQENTNTSNTNPVFTIDPTSRKNYEELFPVEARKFGYAEESNPKTAEEALNARVKKKADRYCK